MKFLNVTEAIDIVKYYGSTRDRDSWIRITEIELLALLGTNYQERRTLSYIDALLNKIYYKMERNHGKY